MGETRQSITDIPTIPIADYDILDEDIEGWQEEQEKREKKRRENRKWLWPLTQGCGPPPKVSELRRRDRKNDSYRQRWFEKHVLYAVGEARGSDQIPWCIRTPDGKLWQLDRGNVGSAIANGRLVDPEDHDSVLHYVELNDNSGSQAYSEVERQRRLGTIASRPEQRSFSETIRRNYGGRCPITGCTTAQALQAAHIKTCDGADYNDPCNGILLRADVHLLFDALLITLTADGRGLELSPELAGSQYDCLRRVRLAQPIRGSRPSPESIREHRRRFHEGDSDISTT